MRTSSAALVAALFALTATSASAAQKTRTKSNNANEMQIASETVQLLWGSDAPSDVHILGGTITPVTGTEWSFGASNSPSASSSGMTISYSSMATYDLKKNDKI